jgi:hypothetical protein
MQGNRIAVRNDMDSEFRAQMDALRKASSSRSYSDQSFSWDTLPDHIKQGIPEPPSFEDFGGNEEAFEDARAGWERSFLWPIKLRRMRDKDKGPSPS